MSTAEVILTRREEVKQLFFNQCWTMVEIGKKLKMSSRQVLRDVQSIKKHLVRYAGDDYNKTLIQWFADTQADYRARLKVLWAIEDEAVEVDERIKVLKEIRETQTDYRNFLQKTGILHEAPKQLEVTISDLLKNINDRNNKRIKTVADSSQN